MSSRAESKTASQFASLTMKLKDKLHSQRIRRCDHIKNIQTLKFKPPDLKLQEYTEVKSVCVLEDKQRAVVSSLQYFKAVVDRLEMDKLVLNQSAVGGLLSGASSGILEAVQTLVRLKPHLHNSGTVSSCLTRLYQSVAQLIRWADQVMLQGVTHNNKETTANVTTMIRAVLDGVKDLVRLAAERQGGHAPLSPVQKQPAVGQPGGFGKEQTSDRTSTCQSPGAPAKEEVVILAPPKPPMPPSEPLPPVPIGLGLSPPALPPKKRLSSSGPAPCRVAIVAPMRHEPEVDEQLQEDDYMKCFSFSSSADSAADNTHCEDDPDYDFLLTDLSCSDALPPLPNISLPPALPEKRRRSAAGMTSSQASPSFGFNSAPVEDSPSNSDDVTGPLSPSKTPPPLPEKKREVHQYLQFLSSYSAQSTDQFYQRPLNSSLRHNSRQQETDDIVTHLDTQAPDSAPSPDQLSVPVLPPKKKQQDSGEADSQCEEEHARNSSQSLQKETECRQKSREHLEVQEEQEEQEEEVLLIDQQKILHRVTMKAEDEEGPDIKAASPDILLVYATGSKSEQDGYREAFLFTYRSFMSPNDVISKLQHRYRHLCDEAADRTAATNTFHLLVTVVDELCVIELDPDLLLLLMDLVFSLLIGGELREAHMLRTNILSKMKSCWQLTVCPQSLAARSVAARPGTLLDFRSQDLAEQLTLLDSELFYKIKLPEVLLWSKEQNEEKSPNLTEFTRHFNNVSFWVRSVVILQDKPQDREKLLLKFLKVMKYLRKLNNLNSYLSILSALDSAPLRRLDWQRNTAEALEEYSSLIDSSSSFRAYRAALAEVEPPCIPYLGLILQDLTFVNLGNPDTLMTSQGSKVNFCKHWQQFNILDTLSSYQQVRYSLQRNDDIISFFNDFSDHLAEEALWELSIRLRPRNAPRPIQR